MITDTEGIILRQVKTVGGRRMLLLFSKKYGKISAGTSLNEKGKGKSALALRPFTYGRYELFKNRDSYNINSTEVIKSYYKIGENVEKYMCASYALEFTDKLIAEDIPAPELFALVIDFLSMIEVRQQKYETLVLAYQVKALGLCGTMPELSHCVICGDTTSIGGFSVKDGGILCERCRNNMCADGNVALIYHVNFGIVDVLKYFFKHSLKSLEKIALEEAVLKELQTIIRSYAAYHLDIGELKSEGFLSI